MTGQYRVGRTPSVANKDMSCPLSTRSGCDRRIVEWHPGKAALAFGPDLAQTRERQVGARHHQRIPGRPAQQLETGGEGLAAVRVELDRDGRPRELHGGVVHDVAPDQELLPARTQEVAGVPGSVAVGQNGGDARQDLGIAGEGLEAVRLDVGGDAIPRSATLVISREDGGVVGA